jgi:hypothetical protein
MPDHAVMELRLIDLVAMATIDLAIHVATAIHLPGRHVRVATVPSQRVPLVTEILGHRVLAATAPTRLVLLAMVIHVLVAMARTALVSLVAMAILAAGPHVAMVILRVGLRVPGETVPIRRAPRATARVQIVRALTARIGHAPIALTATSHAVSGSPMGESVVRSARR